MPTRSVHRTGAALLLSASCIGLAALLSVSSPLQRRGEQGFRAYSGAWSQPRLTVFPRAVLWAWERPEDLSFIDPRRVGVAFLAATLYVHGDELSVRPRLQPLRVPPRTRLIAVVRIETGGMYALASANASRPTAPTIEAADRIADAVAQLDELPGVAAIQLDFDATLSERVFYAAILRQLRARLPQEVPLSITALASWCIGDPWIAGLPIDQAVPMLFRMGPDAAEVRRYLAAGRDFRVAACRDSAGISTDESAPPIPFGRQIFIFHPRPWTRSAAALALERFRP